MNPAQKFLRDREALSELLDDNNYVPSLDAAEAILAAGWTAPEGEPYTSYPPQQFEVDYPKPPARGVRNVTYGAGGVLR